MTESYRSKQLRNIKTFNDRLLGELREMAILVGDVAQRFAVGALPSERVIPNTRAVRDRVSAAMWGEVVRPYFIGIGDSPIVPPSPDPFPQNEGRGERPTANSEYAQLIFDGVEAGIQVEVERQIGILRKYAGDDPVVWDWLTGSRPVEEIGPREKPYYDPFHLFVYERTTGEEYVLSDAIWDTAESTRDAIDRLMAYHIQQGVAAVDIADLLVPYLTDGEKRVFTKRPYGTSGSYSARRLARTEITAAAGRAYQNAALVNPYIEGTKWNLSPSHPEIDICDSYASGGPEGDGVYAVQDCPGYPAHPHCLCYLTPKVVRNPAEVTAALRAEIDAAQGRLGLSDAEAAAIRRDIEKEYFDILRVQGAFNESWMKNALVYGEWVAKVIRQLPLL